MLGVVTEHIGHGRVTSGLQDRSDAHLETRRELGLSGGTEHGALRVQQVELGVGLVEHEVGEEVVETFAKTCPHAEQVVVLQHHALQKRIGAVVGRLVLKALIGQHDGDHHAQRGEQTGEEDREGDLDPNLHGSVPWAFAHLVAGAPHGEDEVRAQRVGLQLRPQAVDVGGHRVFVAVVRVAPDGVEQLSA
ncbi:hypothetical protein FQZ97_773990 [compost metagenome]